MTTSLDIGLSNLSLKTITLSFYSKSSPLIPILIRLTHDVASYVQVLLLNIRPSFRFPFQAGGILPQTGRGHNAHLLRSYSYGRNRNPFRSIGAPACLDC